MTSLDELSRVEPKVEGAFYILNTLVPPADGSRVLGPYGRGEVERLLGVGAGVLGDVPIEREQPFQAFQYDGERFQRVAYLRGCAEFSGPDA